MILTEKEAELKWCALVGGRPEEAKCCASKCMAWRWYQDNPATKIGYCGLAGKPAGVA